MLLIQELESGKAKPLVFVLNANLLAMVKLVNCEFPLSCFILCALKFLKTMRRRCVIAAVFLQTHAALRIEKIRKVK